jgi:hypothetical protein
MRHLKHYKVSNDGCFVLPVLSILAVLRIRIRDPVLFYLWIRDGKKSGSWIRDDISDHISESLETVFKPENAEILR